MCSAGECCNSCQFAPSTTACTGGYCGVFGECAASICSAYGLSACTRGASATCHDHCGACGRSLNRDCRPRCVDHSAAHSGVLLARGSRPAIHPRGQSSTACAMISPAGSVTSPKPISPLGHPARRQRAPPANARPRVLVWPPRRVGTEWSSRWKSATIRHSAAIRRVADWSLARRALLASAATLTAASRQRPPRAAAGAATAVEGSARRRKHSAASPSRMPTAVTTPWLSTRRSAPLVQARLAA